MSVRVCPDLFRPDVSETFRPVSPDSCLLSVPRRTPSGPGERSNHPNRVVPLPPPPYGGQDRSGGLRKINTVDWDGTPKTTERDNPNIGRIERARTAAQSPVTASTRPATLADTLQALSVDLRAAQ